jgi:uncharacterized delta-60 repeat protein
VKCLLIAGGALSALALCSASSGVGGGALDTSFGAGGKAVSNFGGAYESASGVALQPDGKIVVAGFNRTPGTWIVARYTADGGPDGTFGTAGAVKTSFPGTTFAGASAVAVQPDGKIVAAGWAGEGFIALARYNGDGGLDTSFSGDGRAPIPDEPCSATSITGENGVALALASSGKLVVASGRLCYSYPDNVFRNVDVVVARVNPDGGLDASFGSNGKVVSDFGGFELAQGLALQPDGKAVVVGLHAPGIARPGSDRDFLIARYNADGSLDGSFGDAGRVLTDFGGNAPEGAYGVALQSDGKIVASGKTCCTPPAFALARYNTDGSLDTTFDRDGRVVTEDAAPGTLPPQAAAVVVDTRGRIVAAGGMNSGTSVDFAVVRYRSDGQVDTQFGTGGRALTDFASTDDEAAALALGAGGRLVVAGQTGTDYRGGDFALARYTASYCVVPRVAGRTLAQARRAINAADCAVGSVRRKHSKRVRRGRVLAEKPAAGTRLAEGGKVNLVVSSRK